MCATVYAYVYNQRSKKLHLKWLFPDLPVDIYTLVQYWDFSGENYYRVSDFFHLDEAGCSLANVLKSKETGRIEWLSSFEFENDRLLELSVKLAPFWEEFYRPMEAFCVFPSAVSV